MKRFIRNNFPIFGLALAVGALVWAASFGTLPPADFVFDNNTEIQTIDPGRATGQPEGRVLDALYEGLLRSLPADPTATAATGSVVPLQPMPGMAESFDVSDDGKTYTFHIRKEACWSDGSAFTAHDFHFSWMRMLHPETACEYAYQLHYVDGAEAYTSATFDVGDRVEAELADRPAKQQLFPRGTILRGVLKQVLPPSESTTPKSSPVSSDESEGKENSIDGDSIFVIDVEQIEHRASATPEERATLEKLVKPTVTVSRSPKQPAGKEFGTVQALQQILPDFNTTVGLAVPDDYTFVVRLKNPTPYFPELAAFYPLYPVNRACVEKYGSPGWTKAENLVSNGPFTMEFRRFRDRIRLNKNEKYWNAERVKLNVVDIMAIKSETTALNMYLNGQIDWLTVVPASLIPDVKRECGEEYLAHPMLTVYFYRLNTRKAPLNNKKVRQALARAIDRASITEFVTKAGQVPATSFVPPGMTGYESPVGPVLDLEAARKILAEAGYEGGLGMPKLEILYNAMASHQEIAEVIQQQWRENLGVDVNLRNLEWGVFLDSLSKGDYIVARSGWIADYPDPNTFLDMFVTDGANNQTGWGNARYDELIELAKTESNPQKRMQIFREAETILLDEVPIIPIYYQVSTNLVRPGVQGLTLNAQDVHPLTLLEVAPRQGGAAR